MTARKNDTNTSNNGWAANGQQPPQPRRLPEKPSKVEAQKEQSDYLRGTIKETLDDPDAVQFDDADLIAMKTHGIYQQYERNGPVKKTERRYSCMIRASIPGGALTAEQYLVMDELAREVGGHKLRLTTRQSIQYHGVLKGDLRTLMRGLNEKLVSTLAACGDVMRNVMCCPAVIDDPARKQVHETAKQIATSIAPRTKAYHSIWIDGEKLDADDPLMVGSAEAQPEPDEFEIEPLYGKLYLPRKFKLGVAMQDDNCIDLYTQDCGLLAIVDDETRELKGFNLLVGGGLAMTHRKADTFARLASMVGSFDPEHAVDAARLVIEIFRDYGNREDRRHARLKYVIEEFGLDWFIEEFKRRASFELRAPVKQRPLEYNHHLGWTDQGDGLLSYGLFVENGRLRDVDGVKKLTGVREVVQRFRPPVRITADQNILFTNIKPEDKDALLEVLRKHGVPLNTELSSMRRSSMACPALPTCGLALADAERALPGILDEIEPVLAELGIAEQEISVRMTGCPNGCARPYTADIAFVGRSPGVYDVYCGGRLAGDRLVDLLAEKVAQADILNVLRPVLETYRDERDSDEGFGDWWQRALGRSEADRKTLLRGSKDIYNPTLKGDPIG